LAYIGVYKAQANPSYKCYDLDRLEDGLIPHYF